MSAGSAAEAMSPGGEPVAGALLILVGRIEAPVSVDGSRLVSVHAPSALAALGEIAAYRRVNHGLPDRVGVVVTSEAAPTSVREAKEFAAALDRLCPGARTTLVCSTGHGPAPGVAEGVYHAVAPAGSSSLDVARACFPDLAHAELKRAPAAGSPSVAASTDQPPAPSPEVPEPQPEVKAGVEPSPDDAGALVDFMLGGAASTSGLADEPLVSLLIRGQDVVGEALRLIQARCGSGKVELRDTEQAGAVAVSWRGRTIGWLTVPGAPPEVAAAHARWLAAWLTLADQSSRLRHEAFVDPLTGAWNRRYFDRFMASVLEPARQRRRPVTILFFDIDDFKKYNDLHGHGAGDEILRETVRLLKSVIRPTDRVCRVGGDEFVVIFYEPAGPRDAGSRPPESIFAIAQRFQRQIREHRFPKLGAEAPGSLSISGGLATFPWDGRTPEELLECADALAIQSKRAGKNAITIGPGAAREHS